MAAFHSARFRALFMAKYWVFWRASPRPALPPLRRRLRLLKWAKRIQGWRDEGRDVYGFFDGENIKLRAPTDAQTLMQKVTGWPSARC